jgi:arylsulfatase A-like enzyme
MHRINLLLTFLITCNYLLAVDCLRLSEEETKKPNIIFFITDDQLKDMMNFLPEGKGKNLTPATDYLIKEASILNNMYVTSPVCTPSRFSCLTGRYPSTSTYKPFLSTTKQYDNQTYVQWNTYITKEDQFTLPWMLKRNGYYTGIVGKNHVIDCKGIIKPKWNDDPTDDKVKNLLKRNAKLLESACNAAGFDYAKSLYHNNPSHNGVKALLAHNQDWITSAGIKFIKNAAKGDKPFFLWVATTLPHGPTDGKRSWKADPRITSEGLLDSPLDVQPSRESLGKRVAESGIKGWQKENLLWIDDGLAALVKELEKSGAIDNTIIIYFNDHGQRSKGTIYEGGVHSEAFVWKKGGFLGRTQIEKLISNVDFVPTILDFAGVHYNSEMYDGESFFRSLKEEGEIKRESLYFELGFVRGVRVGNMKYIALNYPEKVKNMTLKERQKELDDFNNSQIRRGKPVYNTDPLANFSHIRIIPGGGDAEHKSLSQYPSYYDEHQLYDLSKDPLEQVNLAYNKEYAKTLKNMQKALKSYLSDLPGQFSLK